MYTWLNQLNVCLGYQATLNLLSTISKQHIIPIQNWIAEGTSFKFVGDNVDKQQKARDVRSDHKGQMYHMYSILALKSQVPMPQLPHTGSLEDTPAEHFLPSAQELKGTLTVLVARLLTQYIPSLSFLAAVVPKHIGHKYSAQMAQKSDVAVIDVLVKNETVGKDMLDIMETMHGYLGKDYHADQCVLSGGDQLTCERQRASQRHVMCGNTRRERLEILEPVLEDWHALVAFLGVR